MTGQLKKTPVRRTALAAVAVAALTGVAACGHGADTAKGSDKGGEKHATEATDANSVEALTLADRTVTKAESARVEATMRVGDQMSTKYSGVISWDHGLTGTLTMAYTGGAAAETMRKAGVTSMEARYLSDGFYVDMGDAVAKDTDGKHWIRYGYDNLEKLAGASGTYLKDQMQNATPSKGVEPLLASDDVHKVGPEQVRGQDAVHYSGTIRPADFVEKNSHLTASQLTALKQQFQKAGITTETVDIWVDADGLPLKVAEKSHTATGDIAMTGYYSDYGVNVSVAKPPADETADFADLVKEQQGQQAQQGPQSQQAQQGQQAQ